MSKQIMHQTAYGVEHTLNQLDNGCFEMICSRLSKPLVLKEDLEEAVKWFKMEMLVSGLLQMRGE